MDATLFDALEVDDDNDDSLDDAYVIEPLNSSPPRLHPPLVLHPPLAFALPQSVITYSERSVKEKAPKNQSSDSSKPPSKEFTVGLLSACDPESPTSSRSLEYFPDEVVMERCKALMSQARRRLRIDTPIAGRVHRTPQIRRSRLHLRRVNSTPSSMRDEFEHLGTDIGRAGSSGHSTRLEVPYSGIKKMRSKSIDGRKTNERALRASKSPPTRLERDSTSMELCGETPPQVARKGPSESPVDWSMPTGDALLPN